MIAHHIEHSLLFFRSHSLSSVSLTRSFSTLLHVERRHVRRLALHERSRAHTHTHIRLFAWLSPPFPRFLESSIAIDRFSEKIGSR